MRKNLRNPSQHALAGNVLYGDVKSWRRKRSIFFNIRLMRLLMEGGATFDIIYLGRAASGTWYFFREWQLVRSASFQAG